MKAALYGRYSTQLQRPESIDDQFRVLERLGARHGFSAVAKFSDPEVSGGTHQRAGYQAMLAAARRREFDVIVAEDCSRLWRNLAEQAPRLAELHDLGVHVVTQDFDTREESAPVLSAVLGTMAEQYRKDVARKVRRGLEGLALAGKPAGGRAYGYIPASLSGTGRIEIDQEQAAVVRRIFTMFADGHSPRAIAQALNREGIPTARGKRNGGQRCKSGWCQGAIYNHPTRGLGILNNDAYRGVYVWNRTRWVRSAADSSKRRVIVNPQDEWIIHKDERLRIVSDELWARVKARQAESTRRVGERIKHGLSKAAAGRTGAGPKFLVSGLLRCAHCGSSYAIGGRDTYRCTGHTGGGNAVCTNDATLRRQAVEAAVVSGIKRDLQSPAVVEEICRRVRAALRARRLNAPDHSKRIGELKVQVENLADAIATGALRASPTLAARLADAETELAGLVAEETARKERGIDVTPLLADVPVRAAAALDRLEETLAAGDIPRAREEIKAHVGIVSVEVDEKEIRLLADQSQLAATLLRQAGSNAILCGSGGVICISHIPDFIDIPLR